jgi:IclR family transcriptional regulator, acetate operon repressor
MTRLVAAPEATGGVAVISRDAYQDGAEDLTSAKLPTAGRTVLNGAFAVLESLAAADHGLGLTDLSRASGLAKSSAYRLAEQLVHLGAVQRVARRYYIGPRVGHIGRRWHPDPLLRQASQEPVHTLAVQSGACAALRILQQDRLTVICATARQGHLCTLVTDGPDSTARTATGRVLYAAQPPDDTALPDCWSPREWRRLRTGIRDPRAVVIDKEEAFPSICCVSAPVWWADGNCAGAVTVVLHAGALSTRLDELVVRTARRIERGLKSSGDPCAGAAR